MFGGVITAPSRPVGRLSSSSGRDDAKVVWTRTGRPTTTPGRLLEPHFFSSFLFSFLALTYLGISICLIDQYCVLVVDGRPPRPGRRQGSPSRPRTRLSRPSSSSPRLGRTGRLESVGAIAFIFSQLEQSKTLSSFGKDEVQGLGVLCLGQRLFLKAKRKKGLRRQAGSK